jgi:2-polyprenyl-3-methyl-5-hydroxy-6-metoxy-1,4-benzoquinol methylase
MTVKEHYDNHLGNFYSWMLGDFEERQNEFLKLLRTMDIVPSSSKIAVDLGAGHGIQSVSLAKSGFKVIAVDFNDNLLSELKINAKGFNIEIVNDDIRNVRQFADKEPELIICCGDTLAHLENKKQVEYLIKDISNLLKKGGKIILSFRDYSKELTGDNRFIPLKSDDNKILTCILDFDKETVRVTDLLYEKTDNNWTQRVSSYDKVRITTMEITDLIEKSGMKIQLNKVINRMTNIYAIKQ